MRYQAYLVSLDFAQSGEYLCLILTFQWLRSSLFI